MENSQFELRLAGFRISPQSVNILSSELSKERQARDPTFPQHGDMSLSLLVTTGALVTPTPIHIAPLHSPVM